MLALLLGDVTGVHGTAPGHLSWHESVAWPDGWHASAMILLHACADLCTTQATYLGGCCLIRKS